MYSFSLVWLHTDIFIQPVSTFKFLIVYLFLLQLVPPSKFHTPLSLLLIKLTNQYHVTILSHFLLQPSQSLSYIDLGSVSIQACNHYQPFSLSSNFLSSSRFVALSMPTHFLWFLTHHTLSTFQLLQILSTLSSCLNLDAFIILSYFDVGLL